MVPSVVNELGLLTITREFNSLRMRHTSALLSQLSMYVCVCESMYMLVSTEFKEDVSSVHPRAISFLETQTGKID